MILRPAIFRDIAGITTAMSTRQGGVPGSRFGMNLSFRVGDDPGNVRQNRLAFFTSLGISLDRIAVPSQVHGATIREADRPGEYAECDALLTGATEVYLCITVADCVPILLYSPARGVIGAVHAGWRGTSAGILARAVERMRQAFAVDPSDLIAWLGPSAGTCCYSVGEDVASQIDPRFVSRDGRGRFVDLKSANRQLLLTSGVKPERIEVSPACTISDKAIFHSFRRDREVSGRMMAVIGLRRPPSAR
jgi:polyphenol oxidase